MTEEYTHEGNDEFENDEHIVEETDDVVIEDIEQEKTFGGKNKKDVDKLKKCEEEKQEYLDGWQRARAEMANLKKVHAEEKLLFTTMGKQQIVEDLIPMLDNFQAAFSNKDAWEQVPETWRIGVEYIHKQFLDTMENNGVEGFGAVGDDFENALHEAVETIEGGEKEKIVEVVQSGYKIGDRIVRPAKVKVGE